MIKWSLRRENCGQEEAVIKMEMVVRSFSCFLQVLCCQKFKKKNFSIKLHLNSFNYNDAKKIHANYEQEHYLLIC